jgi:hypothetical protein
MYHYIKMKKKMTQCVKILIYIYIYMCVVFLDYIYVVLVKNEFIYIFCISAKSFIDFRGDLNVSKTRWKYSHVNTNPS